MKGWRTVIYGLLVALLSVFSSPEMQEFIAENLEWVGGGIGTLIVILRALTDSPVFSKQKSGSSGTTMKMMLPFMCIILLGACTTGVPETPRERLLAAEIAFEEVVIRLDHEVQLGNISQETKENTLVPVVTNVSSLLDKAHAAIRNDDLSDFNSTMTVILQGLEILESYLVEQQGVNNGTKLAIYANGSFESAELFYTGGNYIHLDRRESTIRRPGCFQRGVGTSAVETAASC